MAKYPAKVDFLSLDRNSNFYISQTSGYGEEKEGNKDRENQESVKAVKMKRSLRAKRIAYS